jgi:arylsulfatase A-like enzyme
VALTRREAMLAGVGVAIGSDAAIAASRRRPNIVFIMADDLGWGDLSCYGNTDFRTPHLDHLAAEGVRFTDAYANSCVCSPTRVALMTGRYQYRLRAGLEEPIKERLSEPHGLPPSHPTLPSLLKRSGYSTCLIGKWHMGHLPRFGPLKSGYDEFFGIASGGADYFTHKNRGGRPDLYENEALVAQAGYLTDLLTDRAVEYVRSAARAPQPFLLSLHYTAPHWPWEGRADAARAAELKELFDYGGGSLVTYAEMVRAMDEGVGRVLAALNRAGVGDDTIVVFTSDNGGERFSRMWPLVGEKGDLLEGGIRVPAIVRYPARVPRGVVSPQVAITMDWTATLLAMAGAQADPDFPLDGQDLSQVIQGSAPLRPRRLFWRFVGQRQAAVRDGDLKYLRVGKHEYLFDLRRDPRERANLAEAHPGRMDELRQAFATWNAAMLPDTDVEGYEIGPDRLVGRPAATSK